MKKFIFALALLICANSATLVASDLSDAKRNLKSAQKELSSVTSKRDKAQKKQEQLQADYEEALAKMAANQDKPKSLAYKDAAKKSETLLEKLEQNAQLLASLNRQVDSLQNVVSGCESALTQVQQEEAAEEREVEKTDREDNVEEEPVVAALTDPALQPVEKKDHNDAIDLSEDECGTASSSTEEASTSSKPTTFWGKVWRVIKIIFWIIVGLIALVIFMKIGGKAGGSSSSRSSSRSSSSSHSSGSSDKQRKIADKQAEIARCQAKIESLKDSIRARKRNKAHYSDLEQSISNQKQRIASLKGDIARIKAGKL